MAGERLTGRVFRGRSAVVSRTDMRRHLAGYVNAGYLDERYSPTRRDTRWHVEQLALNQRVLFVVYVFQSGWWGHGVCCWGRGRWWVGW